MVLSPNDLEGSMEGNKDINITVTLLLILSLPCEGRNLVSAFPLVMLAIYFGVRALLEPWPDETPRYRINTVAFLVLVCIAANWLNGCLPMVLEALMQGIPW